MGNGTTNVLGIDLGVKAVGLAVVQQPENRVLWCGTLHLSDKIKDLYDLRRTLRRARRSRVRYRKPKVRERGGGSGGTTEAATYFYRRAKGLNQSLRTKCKYFDPSTGEVCEKNTPGKGNVRHLLLEDIPGFQPFAAVSGEYKQAIRDVLTSPEGIARRKERLENVLDCIDVHAYLKRQIRDIVFNDLDGRCEFCRQHILAHHTQTQIPTQATWLPPSIRLKQEFVLKQIRHLAREFPIDRVVIERANFDLQKIAAGQIEDPTEYQEGHRYGFRNTRAALLQEYGARCCYCGKTVLGKKWHIDHIDPRKAGEVNRWDNLAVACEKCNHDKGGRTPKEAGMSFKVVVDRIAGRPVRRSLEPKPIEGSRIHKYMTQTDQGIRMLKNELRAILTGAPIEQTYGYVTAAWRNVWGLEKGKEKEEHHNDAIVIAAVKSEGTPPKVEPKPQSLRQNIGGRRLFDLNPVSRNDNGKYQQSVPVASEVGGIRRDQLKSVVDPRKRALLEREFDRYRVTGARSLPAGALQRLPFSSVRVAKRDCTDSNVRLMPTGHRFKVSNAGGTRVNEAVVVYRTPTGQLSSYAVKNRIAFGPTPRPKDFITEMWRFFPDDVAFDSEGREIGTVAELRSKGQLTMSNGKSRAAHNCRKGGNMT
jgi:hypothetical protein